MILDLHQITRISCHSISHANIMIISSHTRDIMMQIWLLHALTTVFETTNCREPLWPDSTVVFRNASLHVPLLLVRSFRH